MQRLRPVPPPLVMGRWSLDFERPRILGALNVTPDSFSDGGLYVGVDAAVARARQMMAEGADVVDVGGESTRPGADPVSEQQEIDRVLPVIEALGAEMPISIDTRKPTVARAALGAGAVLINDISGLDREMLEVAAEHRAPAIAMHMQGEPSTMQTQPRYDNVVAEVVAFLHKRLDAAEALGVRAILDPGIGFGKTVEHNLSLLRHLDRLVELGAPVLVGASRKSFLGKISRAEVGDRVSASIAAHLAAILQGAHLVRVHDVQAHRQACDVLDHILGAGSDQATSRMGNTGTTSTAKILGIRCSTRVGVTDEERRQSQELVVDVEVTARLPRADDLEQAVDYAEVARMTRRVVESKARDLIETVAHDVGTAIVERWPATSVRVVVHKPGAAAELGVTAISVETRIGASDER